jgi:hypothetical protein
MPLPPRFGGVFFLDEVYFLGAGKMKSFKEAVQSMISRCEAEFQRSNNVDVKSAITHCLRELDKLSSLL